jgi:hypothetical protein
MPRIHYSVTATLPTPEIRDRYVLWLKGGHVQDVVAAGALEAQVVVLTEPAEPLQVETRYVFASAEAFEAYVKGAAVGLRKEGLALFGPETGVSFVRRVGTIQ